MEYLGMALLAVGIVGADQLSKLWVVEHIPPSGAVQAVPGVFHLTYVQNTGAAFSAFQGMRWLFVVVFLLFTLAVIWEFSGKRLPFTRLERWCIAAVYGGGLGNVIDRVRLGYVVDMIETDFIRFPVFNVADCFITCGCILFIVHLALCNRRFWRDGEK